MMNFSDKRKHFRFPAYDDETGVKLNRQPQSVSNTRQTFGSQQNDKVILDPVEMVAEPTYFGEDGLPEMEIERAEPNRVVQRKIERKKPTQATVKQQPTVQQPSPEKKVSLNSEDVAIKTMNNQVYAEPVEQEYNAPQSSFSNKLYETDRNGQAKYRKKYNNRKPFESSYHLPGENPQELFKPKYIPASLIEDKPTKKSDIESTELVKELRKVSEENLLLMDEMDPVEMIDDDTSEKKVEKKNHRLEKSLSGIMKDESSQHLDNYYFD